LGRAKGQSGTVPRRTCSLRGHGGVNRGSPRMPCVRKEMCGSARPQRDHTQAILVRDVRRFSFLNFRWSEPPRDIGTIFARGGLIFIGTYFLMGVGTKSLYQRGTAMWGLRDMAERAWKVVAS